MILAKRPLTAPPTSMHKQTQTQVQAQTQKRKRTHTWNTPSFHFRHHRRSCLRITPGSRTCPAPHKLVGEIAGPYISGTDRPSYRRFYLFLNSKAAIQVVQLLTRVPRNRTHLLVATLNPYMPEISSKLVSALDEDEGAVPYPSFNRESRILFIMTDLLPPTNRTSSSSPL
jgi:hypothetical protein